MFNAKGVRAIGIGLGLYVVTMGAALAELQPGWYFGGFAGQSKFDISKAALDEIVDLAFEESELTLLSGSSRLDDSDTTWSVFGGYRFTPNFAVEVGYQNLGAAAYRSSNVALFVPNIPENVNVDMNMDFKSRGFTLAGVAAAPLGEYFDLHARLGVFLADSKVKITTGADDFIFGETVSGSSQNLYYGVGAAFHLGANWTASLDYQMFKDVGDSDKTGERDIGAYTLSLIYRL